MHSSSSSAPFQVHCRSIIKTAILAVVLLAAVVADASAAGSISGTVTSSTTTLGLQGTVVQFYDVNSTADDPFVGSATTDATGSYTFNLPAGSYVVFTQDIHGYINKFWNNIACSAVCDVNSLTFLTVTTSAVTGIDFVLDPGTRISGTVTSSATGLPVAGVRVYFFDPGANAAFTSALTDVSGNYITEGGSATGNVFASTLNLLGYRNEVYSNIYCLNCNPPVYGTPIAITLGVPKTGIDFVLDPGGTITGTVTDASLAPLANVQVNIYTSTGDMADRAYTDGAGNFISAGLPSGTYFAGTRNRLGLVDKLYSNLLCAGGTCSATSGAPISVTSPFPTGGVDFVLPPGGTITGTVTTAVGGVPLPNVFVGIVNSSGVSVGGAATDAAGVFTTGAVLAGTYYAVVKNVPGFLGQVYNGLPCNPCNPATTGNPITVTPNDTAANVNFALLVSGGSISGTVTDTSLSAVSNYPVQVFSFFGLLLAQANTDASGVYTVPGLGAGSYYVRTSGSGNLINQLYNGVTCVGCNVTTSGGSLVSVTAGLTTGGVNFTLSTGGRIDGTVTNVANGALLQNVQVHVFNASGVGMGSATTNAAGVYTTQGLPAGTYYVRTSNSLGFVDELYDDMSCVPSCTVTAGTPIVVSAGATQNGKNFALSTNLIRNGRFENGTANWLPYATPDMSYMSYGVVNGVFEFTRGAPPPGTANQAVIFQETGKALAAQAPLLASFDLGNGSSVRKRISVLVIDGNFSDLSVCTFWLPPDSPLATYQMRTHTTKAWTNAAIYFYAATAGSNGGSYQLDNVSLESAPSQPSDRTDCVDPTAPAPPGGTASATLLTNGDFGTGQLTPWGTYGTITSQITGGVLEFIKPTGTAPAGVILQQTLQPTATHEILTANFQLGNSSGVRKRVTVLLHDNDFSDLTACTFWLEPGQALSNYAVQSFSTKAWTNTTLSVYPATVGADQWIQLDNATLQRTPGATILGTECGEPGVAPLAPDTDVTGRSSR